jgi:O-antigen ligase
MAPLLFLSLGLAALGSVEASPAIWMSALVALTAAFLLIPPNARSAAFTPLAILVVFLAAWIAATNQWSNPSYTAAAQYHAAFLLGGFLLGRRAGAENVDRLFGAALAFAICLAGWALWQRAQGEARAHALFETPATLAAAINLVLLPGLVLVLSGKRRALLIAALVISIAALFAAGSRGGWLGLAIGGLVAYGVGRRSGLSVQPKAGLLLLGMFAIGWALSAFAPIAAGAGQTQVHSMLAGEATQSSVARLELYELAWRANTPSSLLTGIGYLGYYYLVEAGRAGIATYEQSITYFVHNDYLQTLLELGVPGLLGLLGIAAWPLLAARRLAPKLRAAPAERLILVALAAALGSMAAHAVVDFPFYIPVCLMMYGSALGLLDSMLLRASGDETPRTGAHALMRVRGAVVAGAATLALWILITPVAAQAAAGYAHRQWRAAFGESAAYWFEVARRLEPRDWRYHWYAGQFWFAEAAQNRKPEAARLADRAFSDGYAANAREKRNLLGLIATHRELRALLPAPEWKPAR